MNGCAILDEDEHALLCGRLASPFTIFLQPAAAVEAGHKKGGEKDVCHNTTFTQSGKSEERQEARRGDVMLPPNWRASPPRFDSDRRGPGLAELRASMRGNLGRSSCR